MKKRLLILSRLRNRDLLVVDIFLICLSPWIAFYMRTESFPEMNAYALALVTFMVIVGVSKILVFYFTGLYTQYWRYASVEELITLMRATLLALAVESAIFFAILSPFSLLPYGFPRSVPILDGIIAMILVGGIRLSIRLVQAWQTRLHVGPDLSPALVVGAGVAGAMIVKEMQANKQLGLSPIGYIDDDPEKLGKRIHSVPVLGTGKELTALIKKHGATQVIIAMPTAPGKVIRGVVQACKECGVQSKIIPGLFEIIRGTARVDQFRNIQLEDLLRRGPVRTDTNKVISLLHGARVMVTGAGGSIGSELCRQIRDFGPSDLILLGHGENSIFTIAQELNDQPRRGVTVHTVIADIRDRERMEKVFTQYNPQVIFHAAAHKHVPLMETNVPDAVTNNVFGTRTLVELAEKFGVQKFVMISSDKAVNPSSVMGVTKRIAELLVQDAASRGKRPFVVVRFGNVLGSRGSVVPVFKRQIAAGGPITVTHPEMKRYFMTIPEAVQLVLQAGTMGNGGETFVLDMGEQIKVVELARDLIRLNGLEEGRDIDIRFTGLRPGEKLFEELFHEHDRIERTYHEKIMVCYNQLTDSIPVPVGSGNMQIHQTMMTGYPGYDEPLSMNIDTLVEAAHQGSVEVILRMFKRIVPQFLPPDLSPSLEEHLLGVAAKGAAQKSAFPATPPAR
jgi:FlaA1/EpsC-like NDP-sugar epimerase